ncbi:hypothetical protein [Rikenella microfusus]|uniref:hypothetical protein n=1 Tax=Rikenella microfusus TaxID=28139 RepID=UPI00248F11DB|nr:hypothetical protein [Rikenella microfusus]
MGYNELEVELRKTLAQIARWREMGYMPTIEQGIALGRLQKIYAGLLDLPCSEPETETAISPVEWNADSDHEVIARGMAATDGKPRGGTDTHDAIAPDDESFEPCCDPETPTGGTVRETKADDDGNFADLSVREGSRLSEETHLRQDDEARDLCPPPTEFPQTQAMAEDGEKPATAETTGGAEDGKGTSGESRLSEETHLRQDDEARDLCPPPTEFPQARHATEQAPEQPRIFGIEVSPYARHEIIDTLFHGNTALFETETAKLNSMGSLEEALVYIGETYRWIPENAATIKFIDLLETRFEN